MNGTELVKHALGSPLLQNIGNPVSGCDRYDASRDGNGRALFDTPEMRGRLDDRSCGCLAFWARFLIWATRNTH
jgi:hypothetical protein